MYSQTNDSKPRTSTATEAANKAAATASNFLTNMANVVNVNRQVKFLDQFLFTKKYPVLLRIRTRDPVIHNVRG